MGGAIVTPEIAEKGNNVVGVLTGQLDVGEHDFAQTVYARHQCRCLPFVHGIEMEDVAAGDLHGLANPRRCPPVSQSQAGDELAAEVFDLRDGKPHIAGQELGPGLVRVAMPPEQSLSNVYQDIVGDIAATCHQPEQSARVKRAGAKSASSHRLMCDEGPDHAQHPLASCLVHEETAATGANLDVRSEPHNGRLRKQDRGHFLLR